MKNHLHEKLLSLTGHLILKNKAQQREFQSLQKSLATAVLPDDIRLSKQSNFSFEHSDLFFKDKIPKERIAAIKNLINQKAKLARPATHRVFIREVAIREPLLQSSVPQWAIGAKVDHSFGPFSNADGRQFWFDFFPIVQYVTLFLKGSSQPALLFKAKRGVINVRANKKYNLAPGSIWIQSKFLAPNAPSGTYTGLTISGGKVELSKQAERINGKLTAPVGTTITVSLNLDQPEPSDTKKRSSFGKDARNMDLSLPSELIFRFSANGRSITRVDNAAWKVYGQSLDFRWIKREQVRYDEQLKRIIFSYRASEKQLDLNASKSNFNSLSLSANIKRSAWALPVATIDTNQAIEAAGIGGMLVQTESGLISEWQGLKGGPMQLANPTLLVEPGQIFISDLTANNPHAQMSFNLWKDEINEFGTSVDLTFPAPTLFFYVSNANGNELFMCLTNANFRVDRPVKVNGEPPSIQSLNSLLLIAVSDTNRLIYLFDDNLIVDDAQRNNEDPIVPKQMALAMSNALFKVTQPNGCLLFGTLPADFMTLPSNSAIKVDQGFLFLTFGMYAYLPTLPDPYAANLGVLRKQLSNKINFGATSIEVPNTTISSWLVCRIKWDPPTNESEFDEVQVSFHFAPLNNQFRGISFEGQDTEINESTPLVGVEGVSSTIEPVATSHIQNTNLLSDSVANHFNVLNADRSTSSEAAFVTESGSTNAAATGASHRHPLPDYEEVWDKNTNRYRQDLFSLLDVSTNADLYGISFNLFSARDPNTVTHVPTTQGGNAFPIQIEGMDVVSTGQNIKAFTVPQISWEPLINLSPPAVSGDPPAGFNYYPNDGGPMHIINNGQDSVTLAPLPLTDYLLQQFSNDVAQFKAFSFLTLPFGLKALAVLQNTYSFTDQNGNVSTRKGSEVLLNSASFEEEMKGALQLQLNAGEAFIQGESDMFVGSTVQLNNVLDFTGTGDGDSTLGRTVTEIFNNEFLLQPFNVIRQRGVPLTRIDLSGYGASCFSNWLNPTAAFAATSQAKFDVFVGRCSHEIIQVVSIIYPWAIKVVRTITIFRVGSAYVYRFDSGWKAESDGKFDFTYYVNEIPTEKIKKDSPFEIHPGMVKALYNVNNIIETDEIAVVEGNLVAEKIVDENGLYVDNPAANNQVPFKLQPVYFDADVELEELSSGFNTKKINGVDKNVSPSKKILGYVQVGPRGIPINSQTLRNLVTLQLGSIGGAIDCEVNLAASDQKMRLNRFDFNNSFGANGSDIVFAMAGRGNVLLPKDGAWTLVKHERNTGDVSPVPSDLSVPVIRMGKLLADGTLDTAIENTLLRIANPTELLRQPIADTLNFGFLQSTDTQKALFLTPSFEQGKKKLFSKTPPLFVDAFRIVNSKSIFPNIGDGVNDLGDAISLIKDGTEFLKGGLQDLGEDVWELMDVSNAVENAKQQGYNLLKEVATFDLPDLEFELIDVGDGNFRIYIEYKGKDGNGNATKGDLDFSINSLANDVADTWKSRMGNIGLVVDLAGINRLMTIRGNWDSKKGSEASYPTPEIEFSPELQPVIDILEILQQLQGGDYAGAVANGLKLAMSNKAGSWEYKFEASKEIPVLRFPVPDAVYNDPNTPFKLEAGLTLGAYFNAAVKVTTDAKELLPSAGGILGFYGRLSVMCVSLSAATVYALGQVNLDIAADTKIGPSLKMKFGFGAQIVIGLPVAGNVSVLFVVGVEIFAATGIIELTAFMLFEGHAEILGGLVSITITIEAKGTVSKKAIGGDSRTDLACQVTFGLDISIFLVINISFSTSWSEQRQIA